MHPVFETVSSPSNWPAGVCNFRPEQIAHRSTWSRVPDQPRSPLGALNMVTMTGRGASTSTVLNPLDPGTVDDASAADGGPGWLERPGAFQITACRAGRR